MYSAIASAAGSQPDAAVLVALLVERDGRLVAVLMEVPDPEAHAVLILAPL